MSKFQELSSLIWSVADDVLRGLFKLHEYGDVILPFVILRRLDCVIEPRKDEIYNHPRNYINAFSKNVYDIIENFQLDKPVEKLHNILFSLFFITGITTYIWILNNSKKAQRKGKIQLINACGLFKPMKKSLGSKRKEICSEQQQLILDTYTGFGETEICKIYPNQFFGYTKVTMEQPLRDYERIPMGTNIDQYYQREVKPHLPGIWTDRSKNKTGYEINFTKYFYKYKPLCSVEEITKDLLELEKESEGLMKVLLRLDG